MSRRRGHRHHYRARSSTKMEPYSAEFGAKAAKSTERPPNLRHRPLPPPKSTPPGAPAAAERSPDPVNPTGHAAKAAANPPTAAEVEPKPCGK